MIRLCNFQNKEYFQLFVKIVVVVVVVLSFFPIGEARDEVKLIRGLWVWVEIPLVRRHFVSLFLIEISIYFFTMSSVCSSQRSRLSYLTSPLINVCFISMIKPSEFYFCSHFIFKALDSPVSNTFSELPRSSTSCNRFRNSALVRNQPILIWCIFNF